MSPAHGDKNLKQSFCCEKKLVKTGSPVYIYWARGSDGRNKSVCGAAVKVTLIRDWEPPPFAHQGAQKKKLSKMASTK